MSSNHSRRDSPVGRRSLLEWLGGATVLALASPLLDDCRLAVDNSLTCDLKPGTLTRTNLLSWNERTVDPQQLSMLIASWSLRITGLVQTPVQLSFCDVRGLGLVDQVTDFHCIEGWSVLDVPWNGVPLATLLDKAKPLQTAKYLKVHCVGGSYFEQLPLQVAREARSLLAVGVDGSTLPLAHGFPCRIVVPRLYAYKNPKYVDGIELVAEEPEGYWSQRGSPKAGEVPAELLRPGKW